MISAHKCGRVQIGSDVARKSNCNEMTKFSKGAVDAVAGKPWLKGHSPVKQVKTEIVERDVRPHIFRVHYTLGGLYEIYTLDHGRNRYDDGYWPYTIRLLRTGPFTSNGRTVGIPRILDTEISDAVYRRGPDGDILRNATAPTDGGLPYPRRAAVRCNTFEEIIRGRTEEDSLRSCGQVMRVTMEANAMVDEARRGPRNRYEVSPNIVRERRANGDLVGLDFYLLDDDVVRIMMRNCTLLFNEDETPNANFVRDNPEVAAVYFDPDRTSFPDICRQWGFGT